MKLTFLTRCEEGSEANDDAAGAGRGLSTRTVNVVQEMKDEDI